MTSSPKRKPKEKELPRLAPSVTDGIWCGDESGVREVRGEEGRMRGEARVVEDVRVEERGALGLEEELRELATQGRTRLLLALLEEGAPFVIDMVGSRPHCHLAFIQLKVLLFLDVFPCCYSLLSTVINKVSSKTRLFT